MRRGSLIIETQTKQYSIGYYANEDVTIVDHVWNQKTGEHIPVERIPKKVIHKLEELSDEVEDWE